MRSIYPDSSYGKRGARLGKKFFLGSSGFSLAKNKDGTLSVFSFFLSVANYYGFTFPSTVCFSRIAMSGGCFPCAYRSRKIRLKSKWNTSCRVVPPYPKGQEMLLECFKWKLNLLVHFVYL